MAINETTVVPDVTFPAIPESVSKEMKEYLTELEIVLKESLKGSLWLSTVFEDGILGN